MPTLNDAALHELLVADPARGWRAFVEQYTPSLLATIEQAGVRDRDEAMEVYVHVCEHLAAHDCARLRRHDPAKGTLAAWLVTVVRHVLVDWVRAERGRKRLFGAVRALDRVDREVFEHFYWRERGPAEIAERVRDDRGRPIGLPAVFDAFDRIEHALTPRHRIELLSNAMRAREPLPLEGEGGALALDPPDEEPDPEERLRARQVRQALTDALAELPSEDALIVWLRYCDGLSRTQIVRALHLDQLTSERIRGIVDRIRASLERRGVGPGASLAPQKGSFT